MSNYTTSSHKLQQHNLRLIYQMELFKELFSSCHEYLETHLNYNVFTILISIFPGNIFHIFRASSANNKDIENEYNKDDFFEKPGW